MKVYIAIGYFKDNKNITQVVFKQNTIKDARKDCKNNAFVPYILLTENMFEKVLKIENTTDVYTQVRKLISHCGSWNIVTDYIYQLKDDIIEKVNKVKGE